MDIIMNNTEICNALLDEIWLCLDGIYIINDDTKEVIYVNEYISHGNPEKFIGEKCYKAFLGRDQQCSFCPKFVDFELTCNSSCYQWDYYDKTGIWYKVKNRFADFNGIRYRIGNITETQEIMGLAKEAINEVAELQDLIREYKRLKVTLESEAMRDRMTKLFNRNQYISDLNCLYADARSLGVLFFDINNLKIINDTNKHTAGDIIIKRIASAIVAAQGVPFRAYRIGGDEFVVICMNNSKDSLYEIKSSIQLKLEELNFEQPYICQVAVGASYSPVPCDPENLVLEADRLMYEEKCKIKGINVNSRKY